MLNTGKSFVLKGEHEKNKSHEAGRYAIILKPWHLHDYIVSPQREMGYDILEDLKPAGKSFIDIGCGAGFIAIAAAMLGAGPVVAVDNCDHCFNFAQANVNLNEVQVAVFNNIATVTGKFDIVWSNIADLSAYITLMPDMMRLLADTGTLILETDPEHLVSQKRSPTGAPIGMRLFDELIAANALHITNKIKHSTQLFELWTFRRT